MSSDYKLAIKIGGKLDSSLAAAANQAKGILDQLNGGTPLQKGLRTAGKVVAGVAKASAGSMAAIVGGMAAAGKAATDVGMDFESAMSDLAGTAGITKSSEAYSQYAAAAREVGSTTNKTATEAAQALKYMSLAGWDTQSSIQALDDMVKLSSASGEDLARTSDLVTDSMGALGLTMEDYSGYMDMVARADSAANYSSSEFMEAMIGAGGAARMLGIDMTELGTAAGILANNGTKGSEAGTKLNSIFARMAGQSKPVVDALSTIGATITDTEGNFLPLEDMLTNIKTGLEGVGDEATKAQVMKDLFGTHNLSEAQYLLDSIGEGGAWDGLFDNLDQAKNGIDEFGNEFDVLDSRYKTATDNLKGDLDTLKSATQDFGIEIYENIVGGEGSGLRGAVEECTNIMNNLKEAFKMDGLTGLAQQIGTEIGNIATELETSGPAAIEAATNFASELVSSIGSEKNAPEIGQAAASIITSLGEGFLDYTGEFATAAGNLLLGLGQGLLTEGTAEKWADAGTNLIASLGTWFETNGEEFGATAGAIISQLGLKIGENADKIIGGGIKIIGGLAKGLIIGAGEILSNLPQITGSILKGIWDSLPEVIAMGGELALALKDGFVNMMEGLGEFIFGGDISMNPDIDYDSAEFREGLDGIWEGAGERFSELTPAAQDFYSAIQEGAINLSDLNTALANEDLGALEEMSHIEMGPDFGPEQLINAAHEAGAAYIKDCNDMVEAGIGVSESQEMIQNTIDTTGMTTEESFAAIDEQINNLTASYDTAADEIANKEITPSTMDADALSSIVNSIDAGSIDQLTTQFDTTMTSLQTSADTAATAVSTSLTTMASNISMSASTEFPAFQSTVETSMSASQSAAEDAASGIESAFDGIDLAGIADNMMAGLESGIRSGGQAAINAARDIANQIQSIMSSTLQIHSPSKVMESIGNFVGLGLAGGMEQSAPTVYNAASSLAGSVGQGTTDSLSSQMLRAGSGTGASGGSTGNISFSPQITITGNASEGDVRNALAWSMEQFRQMYDQMKADDRRMAFA